ncbi:speckle targeted PIP5K1A-regulated poly(A) polymerase-like isoform X2 [Pseudomyrmex gracilis]|uniref:speckle targeted PIP5K1A-regulated poly(A) polymerase-like isoform X2 n=1 Tax=Pseudomyrmex gracilis TaxID=219809 RepID=UPI0009952901|nr:speckle targeted PIP5K1A-regulated poly(A) polymerase-like isoform X2 [Pseudomyrmex gracilis]
MTSKLSTESANFANYQVATSSHQQNIKSEQNSQEEDKSRSWLPRNSLYITPLPKNIKREQLLAFFYDFGSVKRHCFIRNSLRIEYHDSKPVDVLLSKPDWFPGEKLCIRRLKKNKDPTAYKGQKKINKPNVEEDPIRYELIKEAVENEVTFDKQLAALLNAVQLTEFEITTRYNVICTHMDEVFRSVFPNCRTYKFGSTVAGLSFKESDLDLYMSIGLPSVCITPDFPPDLLTQMIFKRAKRVMYSIKSVFSNIITIPKAKTPIIKFRYIPTNVSCDITFKNSLGIYKSHFLRYCASHDPRIRPLMLLIKYWARHFGISGIGKLSSYGLVCLIIFYLQQESVGLLPPLLKLQRSCTPQMVNGWQVNFDENTELPPITNNSSIAELFHNFFSFYGQFQFGQHVLCLLDGKMYPKFDFQQLDKLPDYMVVYKVYCAENVVKKLDVQKSLCLQDPIELNQNTGAITSERALISFQTCCMFSADVCGASSENNYDYLLKMLFDPGNAPPMMMKKKKNKNKSKFKSTILPGRFLHAGLPKDFAKRTDIPNKERYVRDNWYFLIFNLVRDIFEKIFKLHVEVVLTDPEMKQQKVELLADDMLSDVHTKSHQKITLHCSGTKCVWYNRKKNNRTLLDIQLSLLEKEAIISDKVLEDLDEQDEAKNVQLDFTCVLEKSQNPVSIIITLTDTNSQNHIFRQFECFVNSWIPKIIDKTLLHMLQYEKTYDTLFCNKKS